jgi:hypothetical protein
VLGEVDEWLMVRDLLSKQRKMTLKLDIPESARSRPISIDVEALGTNLGVRAVGTGRF